MNNTQATPSSTNLLKADLTTWRVRRDKAEAREAKLHRLMTDRPRRRHIVK